MCCRRGESEDEGYGAARDQTALCMIAFHAVGSGWMGRAVTASRAGVAVHHNHCHMRSTVMVRRETATSRRACRATRRAAMRNRMGRANIVMMHDAQTPPSPSDPSSQQMGSSRVFSAIEKVCQQQQQQQQVQGNSDEDESNRRARDGEFIDPEREQEGGGAAVATLEDPERRFDTVLQELAAIQNDGPRRVAVLGTRHMSYLHQQIVELLTYANLLVGNHVITSGAAGTNAAVIRGALRAEKNDLLTVVLPQSLSKQPLDIQEQLKKVNNLVEMSENDSMPLSVASQLCNSNIISRSTHFIAFAFHDSDVVLEAAREAKSLSKIVTLLFLD